MRRLPRVWWPRLRWLPRLPRLEALEDVAGAASGGGAAAAVYPGARASSARPHGLVALICKVFLEGPPASGSAPAAEDLTSKHELCVFG
jgi:hypothetical protein